MLNINTNVKMLLHLRYGSLVGGLRLILWQQWKISIRELWKILMFVSCVALSGRTPSTPCAWDAMKESWPLPDPRTISNTGEESLLHLLDNNTELQRLVILITFWHCQNKVTHHKPAPPVESSWRLQLHQVPVVLCIKQQAQGDMVKWKMVVQHVPHVIKQSVDNPSATHEPPWEKPPPGSTKLNVDGCPWAMDFLQSMVIIHLTERLGAHVRSAWWSFFIFESAGRPFHWEPAGSLQGQGEPAGPVIAFKLVGHD